MSTLEQKKAKRLKLLHGVYELTDGDSKKTVRLKDMPARLELPADDVELAAQYLVDESLLEYATFGTISITHEGVVQVEDALSDPERPTEYFPPAINVIHVGEMHNSAIQQGTVSSCQHISLPDTQRADVDELLDKLKSALEQIELSEAGRLEARAEFATLQAQVSSPRPKRAILREAASSLRAVVESAAGSGVATALMKQLAVLLGV